MLMVAGWTILALILLCAVVFVIQAIACAFACADDGRVFHVEHEPDPPVRTAIGGYGDASVIYPVERDDPAKPAKPGGR